MTEIDIEPRYFTPIEVATLFKVTRPTVYAWLRDPSHPLKGFMVGSSWRIPESSIKKFLKEMS